MPELHAFCGLRYDLGHVGALSNVVAPPYDVIDSELQNALYERHPANVIRLILNRAESGDESDEARYARAARHFRDWMHEGVLQRDPDPALYVYHQSFDYAGTHFTRRGFMGRVRLERFGEGRIYPHEETHAAAKADRLRLTRACRANLSQIFGIYPDAENAAQNLLEQAITGVAPLEATDHLGVVHRLWLVTDVKVISEVTALMSNKPMFVADGHHRYETACTYRDELAAARTLDPADPANFVLMMCISMSDPGMIVLPTHRLFRGVPPMTVTQLQQRLGDCFTTEALEPGIGVTRQAWDTLELEGEQGTLGLFAAADQRWVIARITAAGRERMAQLSQDHSSAWQGLGVALLHRLVVDTLLESPNLPKPRYVHLVDEVITGLEQGDTDGQPFSLAALVMPATLDHIQAVSENAERMPAKSTYFYPKLLSGLVIHRLEA